MKKKGRGGGGGEGNFKNWVGRGKPPKIVFWEERAGGKGVRENGGGGGGGGGGVSTFQS